MGHPSGAGAEKGMLVGTHRRKLDEKWRLPIPNELFAPGFEGDRENLFFAPAGDHLIFFPEKYFQKLADQLFGKSVVAHQDLRRKFFGSTYPKARDKNGRVQIPEPLRARSGLTERDEVVIVGTGSYAEVLPASRAPEEPGPEEMTDIFATLEGLGGNG